MTRTLSRLSKPRCFPRVKVYKPRCPPRSRLVTVYKPKCLPKKTEYEEIVKPNGNFNAHMWLEDDEGNVYDYPDEALKNSCRQKVIHLRITDDIVREPFEEHLFTRVKNAMIKTAVRKIKSEKAKAVYGLDEQTILKTLRNFARETCGYCLIRCYFKKLSNPQKWKIKVGHLGFRQVNGDIFWSYG